MEALIHTQTATVWFHHITMPATQLMATEKISPPVDSAKKLIFEKFLIMLLYFYLQGLDSLRSLITNLKTDDNIHKIDLFPVGLSTVHDAFHRYSASRWQAIYFYLLQKFPVYEIEEFKELGRLILTDGSIFPMAINNFWAEFKQNCRALKLHLSFQLNQMIPSYFIITDAKHDERKVLATMIEKAVTYIADRGYLSFDLFYQFVIKEAFFIIRSRNNITYQLIKQLPIPVTAAVKQLFFRVTDELVRFNRDKHSQLYRRISFRTHNTVFVLITNRLDLSTYQIIRLYAFRWQIELFFRHFKRMLNAIHLINNSPNGVTIQFYSILIVNLLLLQFKYQQRQQYLFRKDQHPCKSEDSVFTSPEHFIKILSAQIPREYKITKQEIQEIRNSLFKSIQLKFVFL